MNKDKLVEIKKGEVGTGLLIEHDAGFISNQIGNNQKLFEDINSGQHDEFFCPKPFIVSAVFQKFGLENANGRIYPEHVLKREVAKYQQAIKERNAIGECYRPEVECLCVDGWKQLSELTESDIVVSLNPKTLIIENTRIKSIISRKHTGDMIHVYGENIDEMVTPGHRFPIFTTNNEFIDFYTAKEMMSCDFCDGEKIFSNSKNEEIQLSKLKFKKNEYNGDVMCIEMEDNHIWKVRSNNYEHWTGNCNHPSESVIDLSRTAINIIELHWEGNTLVGQLEVLISEGFRRYGLITCQGDQVANLLLSGIKIGVSSRGLGSVQNKMGVLYVDDDFEIVCWDVVSSPSTNGAYISMKGKEDLQQYIENKDVGSDNLLSEKIEKFKEWLE